MRRGKKRNKIIIAVLICIICLMGVGYATFQTQLDIKGNTEISSEWNIRIISAEVSDTGGSAENVKNTYTDLTANLEANLYSKGDYVEYKVIVENAGTFDAKLDTLGITNSNNEAVKITSTGLVKGQTLYKGETATLIVRIEYNSNYDGDASGTSGETTIDLGFVQNSEGTIVPTNDHLVTYDYTTNGGESTTAENEYVAEGTSINLSYTATKKNYEFKGWNTNPQAAEGLSDLTMGTEDITLYAIFEAIDTTPPIIESINTSSTTNSITAVVIASDEESGISKYEFSIDGGKTWIDNGVSNTYTFTGLKQGTSYNIDVRVTNEIEMTSNSNTETTTSIIENPTFMEQVSENGKMVTITYPNGCGDNYVCTYIKDSGEEIDVTSSTIQINFTDNGNLVAKANDGTNEVSSSYSVTQIVSISVYSVKGGDSILPKDKAINGETITFTATPNDDFTYQGATIVCNNGLKYTIDDTSMSFSISDNNCTSAILYPSWKKNDYIILSSVSSYRDTTFTMDLWDTGATKPIFGWYYDRFYAMQGKKSGEDSTTIVSIRGQASSDIQYNVNEYSELFMTYSGSIYNLNNIPSVFLGVIEDKNIWLNESGVNKAEQLAIETAVTDDYEGELSLSLDNVNGTYYVAFQFLSYRNTITFNVGQLTLIGETYSYDKLL